MDPQNDPQLPPPVETPPAPAENVDDHQGDYPIVAGPIVQTTQLAYVPMLIRGQRANIAVRLATTRVSITTASSYTIDLNTTRFLSITALASGITITTTGTPEDGVPLIVRIVDNGTPRAITWDTGKFISKGQTLPTTTTANKCLSTGLLYDAVLGKEGCVAVSQES